MKRAVSAGFGLFAAIVASCALPVAARADMPPHIADRIDRVAREGREIAQRDAALPQYLGAPHLAGVYTLRASESIEAEMNAVVIGAIAEAPAFAGDIVAAAIAAAPRLRDSIARNAASAFPALAATIYAAAGGAPPEPYYAPAPVYAQAPGVAVGGAGAEAAEDGPGERIDDPYEGVNRAIFVFNDALDTYLLRPVAATYGFVMPEVGKRSVSNFVRNLAAPVVFANDALQGEGGDASVTAGRFVVNSTFGLFGLFDVADAYGLSPHHADFGQTLYSYGLGPGSYVMLPILGPSTTRDSVGLAVDAALNPLTYLLTTPTNLGIAGGKAVVKRETLIVALDDLRASSVDYYAALRSAYYQDRAVELRKGLAADPSELDTMFESVE